MMGDDQGQKAHREGYFGRDLEAMSFAVNYHNWILDEFGARLQGKVAEIGAGSGNFTQELLLRPGVLEIEAYEPSPNMFPILQDRLRGLERASCKNGFFGDFIDGNKSRYDTILYVNVLEHVLDHQTELRLARDCLRPGGRLLVFVPACPFLMSDFDRRIGHHRRYTRAGLKALVESAGFQVETCKYFDSLGIIPWYLVFVRMRRILSGGNVELYDRWVVPPLRRLEALLTPPIGKNLILSATRTS